MTARAQAAECLKGERTPLNATDEVQSGTTGEYVVQEFYELAREMASTG